MNEKYDVVATANQAGNFRVFVQALEAAGLKETLLETGPFTLLAPVDDAFVHLPQTELEHLFKTENRASLLAVLKNHIIPGELLGKDLKRRDEIRSVKGEELRIESRGAGLWVNEAQVTIPDVKAMNGVLHGIDTVLIHAQVTTAD
jgi:uncharacterized surface protein with fasciclin (FAS1) repeats